jgi:hypothetical protein
MASRMTRRIGVELDRRRCIGNRRSITVSRGGGECVRQSARQQCNLYVPDELPGINGEQAMPKLSAGHRTNSGNLRISATLSKPLFRRLRTRAAKEGKTVSETVAMLCSIGLLDLDECDRFEPEVNPRPHAHQQH